MKGVGRVLGVAEEEVIAALADGTKVVDSEGAEGDVLFMEGLEGLVS